MLVRMFVRMRNLAALLVICLSPSVVAAGACEDLWFTRNLIMDRAGYCFSSPLGQAMFDNSDCIGTQVQLGLPDMDVINRLRSIEAGLACRMNTNQTWLDLPDIEFRRMLSTHPVLDDQALGWGCNGWTGPAVSLYAGYHAPLQAIGQIVPGDYVVFKHYSGVPGWSYVTSHTYNHAALKSAGWLYWPGDDPCVDIAG